MLLNSRVTELLLEIHVDTSNQAMDTIGMGEFRATFATSLLMEKGSLK